jgi:hypothetical protein
MAKPSRPVLLPVAAAREDARPPEDNVENLKKILMEGERPREPRGYGSLLNLCQNPTDSTRN